MADAASSVEVAYQGAPGAFSEDAARALSGFGAGLRPCRTLEEAFALVTRGEAHAAVVPIENSLAGPVPGCADLIARSAVHIVAEHLERIVHALVAAPGVSFEDVRRVHSHPVAIAQCEDFFRRHPRLSPVPAFDTAGAVAAIVGGADRQAGAIASARAAALYGGAVLADAIQDRADNVTRFLRIEAGPFVGALQSGRKTSVVCRLANMPGALYRALEPFVARGLNLTRIESRPLRDTPFAYEFHLDVGPTDAPGALGKALSELGGHAVSVRVMGQYAPA